MLGTIVVETIHLLFSNQPYSNQNVYLALPMCLSVNLLDDVLLLHSCRISSTLIVASHPEWVAHVVRRDLVMRQYKERMMNEGSFCKHLTEHLIRKHRHLKNKTLRTVCAIDVTNK